MPSTQRIPIDVPSHPTALVFGRGALDALGAILEAEGVEVRGRSILVVADAKVLDPHAAACTRALRAAGARVTDVALDATEPRKTIASVERVWSAALEARLDRTALIVAVGGGLVGDVAGFAAATYLRGVDLVQVPTTLLAMVDASIGGKTGVNLVLPDGGLGKNLAGAFWQPKLTVADPAALATLPDREYRSGLAECVKHAIIDGEAAFAALEADAPALARREAGAIDRLVPRAAAVKGAIVARDPLERGERAKLNLGHTFGHAFETAEGVELLHGEAVAIGLVAAIRCAALAGMLSERSEARPERGGSTHPASALESRVGRLLAALWLPASLPAPLDLDHVRHRMGFDKKSAHGRLRLVLPRAVGAVEVVPAPADAAVVGALAAVGCAPRRA